MQGLPPGPRSVSLVGSLCFSRGKQRFSVAGESSKIIMRFSAGNPRGLLQGAEKRCAGQESSASGAKARRILNRLRHD
jgi:hypothetical protein